MTNHKNKSENLRSYVITRHRPVYNFQVQQVSANPRFPWIKSHSLFFRFFPKKGHFNPFGVQSNNAVRGPRRWIRFVSLSIEKKSERFRLKKKKVNEFARFTPHGLRITPTLNISEFCQEMIWYWPEKVIRKIQSDDVIKMSTEVKFWANSFEICRLTLNVLWRTYIWYR